MRSCQYLPTATFVDYIVRCTHRIWEQKDIGLCRTHYADSCVMHTLNGPSSGLENVVQGTLSALSSFADRQVIAEDVIWSEDAPGLFYSSHRITSRSTHEGIDYLDLPHFFLQMDVDILARTRD